MVSNQKQAQGLECRVCIDGRRIKEEMTAWI